MSNNDTPRAIDRDELGRRLSIARAEGGWAQREVVAKANYDGINEAFVSALERGLIAFREPTALERTEVLCRVLGVEIPWVSALSQKSKALVVAKKSSPGDDPESKIEDAEVTALYLCNKALGKLSDEKSINRVVAYLQSRYLAE